MRALRTLRTGLVTADATAVLATKGRAACGENNGLHVTLHPNGKVTPWPTAPNSTPSPPRAAPPAERTTASMSPCVRTAG
ncbi:hypothetical protein [Streptomyces sp. NPDC001153]